jgi:type I restriction enzyme S subunit
MSAAWQEAALGEVLTPANRDEGVDPIREYRLLGIRLDGNGPFLRETVLGSQSAASKLFGVRNGDFIYSRLFACRGAFGIVGPELDGCYVSAEFPTFVPVSEKLDARFLLYWFQLPSVISRVNRDCAGSTPLTRNRFKQRFFLEMGIPLPPLPEQRRIVAKIEHLAGLVEEAKGLRRSAQEEQAALAAHRASQVVDSLPDVAWTPIGELGCGGSNPVQTGPFGAQLHGSDFVDAGVPVLNVGNVWPEGLRLASIDHVLPEKARQLVRYALKPEDLLFARTGATLGKVCLVPKGCDGWLMTGHLFRVRLDARRCLPAFAFAALRYAQSVRTQVLGGVRGATRPGFNTGLLSRVRLPLVPVEKQASAVECLRGLQRTSCDLKALQERTATELDAMIPAILDRAFRGEL